MTEPTGIETAEAEGRLGICDRPLNKNQKPEHPRSAFCLNWREAGEPQPSTQPRELGTKEEIAEDAMNTFNSWRGRGEPTAVEGTPPQFTEQELRDANRFFNNRCMEGARNDTILCEYAASQLAERRSSGQSGAAERAARRIGSELFNAERTFGMDDMAAIIREELGR